MQQTRLDQWLKRKFVHEIWVYTYRFPEELKKYRRGAKYHNYENDASQKYDHLFTFRNQNRADAFVEQLRTQHYLVETAVKVRKGKFARFLNVRHRSVTYLGLEFFIIGVSVCSGGVYLFRYLSQEEKQVSIKAFWEEIVRLATQ